MKADSYSLKRPIHTYESPHSLRECTTPNTSHFCDDERSPLRNIINTSNGKCELALTYMLNSTEGYGFTAILKLSVHILFRITAIYKFQVTLLYILSLFPTAGQNNNNNLEQKGITVTPVSRQRKEKK